MGMNAVMTIIPEEKKAVEEATSWASKVVLATCRPIGQSIPSGMPANGNTR